MQIPLFPAKSQSVEKEETAKPTRLKVGRYLAILLALIVYLSLNLVVTALEPVFLAVNLRDINYTPPKLSLFDKKPNTDILFMGTSRVLSGFDTQVVEDELYKTTGVKVDSFNMGMAGASIDLNYLVLKNYIPANKMPKYIVYGITEFELVGQDKPYRSNKVPYFSTFLRPDDFELYSGNTFEDKANFVAGQVFPLFRDQKLISDGLGLLLNQDSLYEKDVPSNIPASNFVAGFSAFPPTPEAKPGLIEYGRKEYEPYLPNVKIQNMETIYLERFLSLAKSRGIQVLLVNMPVTKIHQSWWHNDQNVKNYCDAVQDFAQKSKVPLINLYCNDESIYNPDLYIDSHHLNTAGAKVLSQRIAHDYFEPLFKVPAGTNDLYQAGYADLHLATRQTREAVIRGTVTVENKSRTIWPIDLQTGVRLAYHWLDSQGKVFAYEGTRSYFTSSLFPGQKQQISFSVTAPQKPGNYILEIDLVREQEAWFGSKGNPTLRRYITVT